MKRGILGGTFDPVHRAHVDLAECAQEQLGLGSVLWIPAGEPWRKKGRKIAPAKHRVAMLELTVEYEPTWSVSSIELERTGPTYSVDTLEQLREAERRFSPAEPDHPHAFASRKTTYIDRDPGK